LNDLSAFAVNKPMTLPATQEPPTRLSESQKSALVKLLGDEDTAIYQVIRGKIISCGTEAVQWVRPHTLSSDPLLRRRAQEIVQHFARQEADNRFVGFCLSHGEDLDLEDGCWLLARTQYPDINMAAYRALLDSFAEDLRERLRSLTAPTGMLGAINDYMFGDLGFSGNQENYYDPDNSYLNRVVDRRTGNAVSLCTLYWLLARRLRLPLVGIGIPGHFLCRYQSSKEAIFIDVFSRGRLLTRAECVRHLQQSSHGFQESYLHPTSPRRTLWRVCSNLRHSYTHMDCEAETDRIQRYLVALAK
jgi:regulator of sirC expression with transglutaminase-like and TPR domain